MNVEVAAVHSPFWYAGSIKRSGISLIQTLFSRLRKAVFHRLTVSLAKELDERRKKSRYWRQSWFSYEPSTRATIRNWIFKKRSTKIKIEKGTEKAQPKQEKFVDPDDTPIVEGDICEILNNYKGLKGTRFKVTKSENDKIHFRINGYPTWRIRKNVKKISHSRE